MIATKPLTLRLTWLIRAHMAEVLEIEALCFEFPWIKADFIRCLRQRNSLGMVALKGERVAGYIIYALERGKIAVHNFAVLPAMQRHGVGRLMIEKLKAKLNPRRNRLVFDVRERNLDAQLFLRSQGFRVDRIKRGRWENGEDGYRFVWRLP